MKKLVIPCSRLPRELRLARPVAAQADLDVARAGRRARLDEPVHRRPVRDLDAEDLRAGVGVRVEVDEADRAVARGARRGCRARRSSGRRRARSGSRRRRATWPTVCSIASCERGGVGRERPARRRSRRSAAPRRRRPPPRGAGPGGQLAARIARGPKRAPGPVGDEVVGRRADDRDVDARRARPDPACTGAPPKVSRPGVVGLLAVLAPALERVDHGAIVACGEGQC